MKEMKVKRRMTRLGVAAHLTLGAGPVENARAEIQDQAYDEDRRCKHRLRAVVVPHRRAARGSRTITMKIRLGLTFLATGTLLLAVASACSDDAGRPPADPIPSSPSSATAPTTSASPTSPTDAAATAASALMETYYTVVDELGADPDSDLARLESVATSTQLTAQRTFISRQHEKGRRQRGRTTIGTLTVQSVNLDNSDPDAGKVPTVVVDVCWDVSRVDVLDETGTSIVSPDRPDTGWTRYTVANYEYAADPSGGWRVATGQDLEQAPCAAS